ncbi:hypothetical protein QQF64_026171 [Cirrhinus molitorella]|uniref:Uncharacterized protein n=1 Tax=Cirrhinus molitorella TaxID=172907 RepID=A0ABR3NR50_9TELE
MANSKQVHKATRPVDHDYNLTALTEACDEEEIEAMMVETAKTRDDHTPLPSPNPKKLKQPDEITNEVIFDAIQTLIKRFDEQDKRLKRIEKTMEENAQAVKVNKEDIGELKGKRTSH